MSASDPAETTRVQIQHRLDSLSTQGARNEMGQFATPPELALQILQYAVGIAAGDERIKFLDPGVGTGAFYSALLSTVDQERIEAAHGYETDRALAQAAKPLWEPKGLQIHHQDFTTTEPPTADKRFNLVICNPPYVRHHHIGAEKKRELKERLAAQGNMELSGLAGLYTHFMGLSHPWMEEGAVAGWLVPSEFMDVNYGKGVRDYLTSRVTLLHIHRFDPERSQFKDALVSSAVVWFRNSPPPRKHTSEDDLWRHTESARTGRASTSGDSQIRQEVVKTPGDGPNGWRRRSHPVGLLQHKERDRHR